MVERQLPKKNALLTTIAETPINIEEVTAPQAFPRYICPVLLLNSQ
jgi:hypothetical protein